MCKYRCLQRLRTTGLSQAYEELPSQKLLQQTVWSVGSLYPRVSAQLCQCAVLPAIPLLAFTLTIMPKLFE